MLSPDLNRVLAGEQPINQFDRHALLVSSAMIGGGRLGVLNDLGKIFRCHDDKLRASRVVDELGAGERREAFEQPCGGRAHRAQAQRFTHRYAPPLGAISKTSRTPALRSSVYDTRQSPTRIRNPFGTLLSGRRFGFRAGGSAATLAIAWRMSLALAGCIRDRTLRASRPTAIRITHVGL